jgi:hypothetical protein
MNRGTGRANAAIVIATVSLMSSLAGGAVAARLITGKQIRNDSVTGADIKDRSLLAKDFRSGQLPAGKPGPAGPTGAAGRDGMNGRDGNNGNNGAPGEAVAYATIKADGDVDPNLPSKNLTDGDVSKDVNVAGIYCFSVAAHGWKSAVVSGRSTEGAFDILATVDQPVGANALNGCLQGEARVRIYRVGLSQLVNNGFTIWFED